MPSAYPTDKVNIVQFHDHLSKIKQQNLQELIKYKQINNDKLKLISSPERPQHKRYKTSVLGKLPKHQLQDIKQINESFKINPYDKEVSFDYGTAERSFDNRLNNIDLTNAIASPFKFSTDHNTTDS